MTTQTAATLRQLSYHHGYDSTEAKAMCAAADRTEAMDAILHDLLDLTPASVGYDLNAVYGALDALQARAKAVVS